MDPNSSGNVVSFDFAVGDRVTIAANGLEGKLAGQWNGRQGRRYSVEYADANGFVTDRWFDADEISAA